MNKAIKISLLKGKILENVKNETFFRGQVVKAADQAAITEAYHEQAGNDAYQERILERGLYSNLSALKTFLSDYLASNGDTTGSNIHHEEEGGIIIVTMVVSDRFNSSYVDPLAKLCSKYIEDSMLMDWWRPVNEKQAAVYQQFVERGRIDIIRCFNKLAPTSPIVPYTTTITLHSDEIVLGRDQEADIIYFIDKGAVDDVEVKNLNPAICCVLRGEHCYVVKGIIPGNTKLLLYSKHNDQITAEIKVDVKQDEMGNNAVIADPETVDDIPHELGGGNVATEETASSIADELV